MKNFHRVSPPREALPCLNDFSISLLIAAILLVFPGVAIGDIRLLDSRTGIENSVVKFQPDVEESLIINPSASAQKYVHDSTYAFWRDRWWLSWNGNLRHGEAVNGQRNYLVTGRAWNNFDTNSPLAAFSLPESAENPTEVEGMDWHPNFWTNPKTDDLECWWFQSVNSTGDQGRSLGVRSILKSPSGKWLNYKVQLQSDGSVTFSTRVREREVGDFLELPVRFRGTQRFVPFCTTQPYQAKDGTIVWPVVIAGFPTNATSMVWAWNRAGVIYSRDQGESWKWSIVPTATYPEAANKWETWVVESEGRWHLWFRNFSADMLSGRAYSYSSSTDLTTWSPPRISNIDTMPMRNQAIRLDDRRHIMVTVDRAMHEPGTGDTHRSCLALWSNLNGVDWSPLWTFTRPGENIKYAASFLKDGYLYVSSSGRGISVRRFPLAFKPGTLGIGARGSAITLLDIPPTLVSNAYYEVVGGASLRARPAFPATTNGWSIAGLVLPTIAYAGANYFRGNGPGGGANGDLPIFDAAWRLQVFGRTRGNPVDWSLFAPANIGGLDFIAYSWDGVERKFSIARRSSTYGWVTNEFHALLPYLHAAPQEGFKVVVNGQSYVWRKTPHLPTDVPLTADGPGSAVSSFSALAQTIRTTQPDLIVLEPSTVWHSDLNSSKTSFLVLSRKLIDLESDGRAIRVSRTTFAQPNAGWTLNGNNEEMDPRRNAAQYGALLYRLGIWRRGLSFGEIFKLYNELGDIHRLPEVPTDAAIGWASADYDLNPQRHDQSLWGPVLTERHGAAWVGDTIYLRGDGSATVEVPSEWNISLPFRLSGIPAPGQIARILTVGQQTNHVSLYVTNSNGFADLYLEDFLLRRIHNPADEEQVSAQLENGELIVHGIRRGSRLPSRLHLGRGFFPGMGWRQPERSPDQWTAFRVSKDSPRTNASPSILALPSAVRGPTGGLVGPVPFEVFDNDTPPENLTVVVSSSNPSIPAGTRVFLSPGSEERRRALWVFPPFGRGGTATGVKLTVRDPEGGESSAFLQYDSEPGAFVGAGGEGEFGDRPRAELHPSLLTVTGLTGVVGRLRVQVPRLLHPEPSRLQMILVHPDGTNAVRLLGRDDAQRPGSGSADVEITLGFDDAAAESAPGSGALVSGIFRPQPGGWLSSFNVRERLSDLSGLDPNGTWRLLVFDDVEGVRGSLPDGWRLLIETAPVIEVPNHLEVLEDGVLEVPFRVADGDSPASAIAVQVRLESHGGVAPFVGDDGISLTSDPEDPSRRVLRIQPLPNISGSWTNILAISASDGVSTSTRLVSLAVIPVDDPPQLEPLTDVSVVGRLEIPLAVRDIDTPAEALSFDATAEPLEGMRASVVWKQGVGPVLVIETSPGARGEGSIQVVVRDGSGQDARTLRARFEPANLPPRIVGAVAIRTPSNRAFTQGLRIEDSDSPSSDLRLNVRLVPETLGKAAITQTADQWILSFQPSGLTGNGSLRIAVSDGQASVEASFEVEVLDPYRLQVVVPAEVRRFEDEATRIPIHVTGSEVANSIRVIRLGEPSFPDPIVERVDLAGSGTNWVALVLLAKNRFGATRLEFAAEDSLGGRGGGLVNLTILPVDDPPKMSLTGAIEVVIPANRRAERLIQVADPDTEMSQLIVGAMVSPETLGSVQVLGSGEQRKLEFRPSGVLGTGRIDLVVSDGNSEEQLSIPLKVTKARMLGIGIPDVLSSVEDQPLTFEVEVLGSEVSSTIQLVARVVTEDILKSIEVLGSAPRWVVTAIPQRNSHGQASLEIKATDANGDQANRIVFIPFAFVDDPPEWGIIPDKVGTPESLLRIELPLTDPDTAIANLRISGMTSFPELISRIEFERTDTGWAALLQLADVNEGKSTVILKAEDGTNSAETSFLVQVLPPSITRLAAKVENGAGQVPFMVLTWDGGGELLVAESLLGPWMPTGNRSGLLREPVRTTGRFFRVLVARP